MAISEQIIYGLERISEVYKTLLWEKAKVHGISPIQIQLLLFIANHKSELCNITQLSKEFDLTKPTVSDAVKVLHHKKLLDKDFSSSDSRSYLLFLTNVGQDLIKEIGGYADPLENILTDLGPQQLESLYGTLTDLIFKLNQKGIIQVQRTCMGCRFHQKNKQTDYCNYLEKELFTQDIRLDCPEFDKKA